MNKGDHKIHKKQFVGTVTSAKMDKTVTVVVDRIKLHPKYQKRYSVSKKFKAHSAKNEYKIGDKVVIQECRPLSKEKRWRVIGKL